MPKRNSSKPKQADQIAVKAGDGDLTKESVALGEEVRAISTTRFLRQMGHLDPKSIIQIGAALKIAVDL
jgi:mRNA interferase MazF